MASATLSSAAGICASVTVEAGIPAAVSHAVAVGLAKTTAAAGRAGVGGVGGCGTTTGGATGGGVTAGS